VNPHEIGAGTILEGIAHENDDAVPGLDQTLRQQVPLDRLHQLTVVL
jgi:hypothetical protein